MYKTDFSGQKFGMLTVICDVPPIAKYQRRVKCVCDCGKETNVILYNLKNNHTKSCGCFCDKRRAETHTKHGMCGTPEHTSYRKMIERCYTPSDISYHNYGGKGIKVDVSWLGDSGFINFLADMGLKPTPKHSIDRHPNKHGDYGPQNCRWATPKQQSRNRTNNKIVECDGKSMTMVEWSEYFGVQYQTIHKHLKKGKSFQDIYRAYAEKKELGLGKWQFERASKSNGPRGRKKKSKLNNAIA